MCRKCHGALSDELVIAQLEESLPNPQYERWNTTSLSHMIIAIEGTNGPKAHDLALELANGFYNWYLGPSNGAWEYVSSYTPKHSLEPFPSSTEIREMIDDAQAEYEDHTTENVVENTAPCKEEVKEVKEV